MIFIKNCFLSLCALVSCFAALSWIHFDLRRKISFSILIGIMAMAFHLLSMYFLGSMDMTPAVFIFCLPVLLFYPKFPIPDTIAVVCISCAFYGTFHGMTALFFSLELLSPFFRFALEALGILGALFLVRQMYPYFPGENWKSSFLENAPSKKIPEDPLFLYCSGLTAFAFCLGFPVFFRETLSCLFPLELFALIAGLFLFSLILSHRQENQSLLSEQQYRAEMQSFMSVIRSQRHDYNFHVQTIYGLLERKDYVACEAYLNELLKDSISVNRLLSLADTATSALILSFQSQASQAGIRMEISIENNLSQIVTNVYETNKIIGNLLQNALDETELLSDKSYGIRLSILKRGEFCIIRVSNRTRSKAPMEQYQIGISSKTGHEGIGIASIRHLALRYGGTVYSRMEGDIIHFVAKIPLTLAKESA